MQTTDFKLENGDKVKSLTTGFKGMITARADHLHGCNRYMVQPMGKDDKLPDSYWFDEDDLGMVKKNVLPRANNHRGGFPSMIK